MEFSRAFRMRIADVTGFSVGRGKKMLQRRLLVLGNGATLATADGSRAEPHEFRAE